MHFPDDGLLDVFGVVPVGRVQEDRESCRAFHERADRAFVGRAAHISPRVAYSTPSNTHLFTWPSRQSARRCDDHWNPPRKFFVGGGVAFPSDGSRMACSRQDTEKYVQDTEKYMNAISIALPFRQWNYLRCMAKDDAVFRRMERKESNWH